MRNLDQTADYLEAIAQKVDAEFFKGELPSGNANQTTQFTRKPNTWANRQSGSREVTPEIEQRARELLDELREVSLPFPDDWDDDQKFAFAIELALDLEEIEGYIDENFLSREQFWAMVASGDRALDDFPEYVEVFNKATAVLLFLSDPELAFQLTLGQRVQLMTLVKNNIGNLQPVANFLIQQRIFPESNRTDANTFAWQIERTFISAQSGQTYHDWLTSGIAGGFTEVATNFQNNSRSIRSFEASLPSTPRQGQGPTFPIDSPTSAFSEEPESPLEDMPTLLRNTGELETNRPLRENLNRIGRDVLDRFLPREED